MLCIFYWSSCSDNPVTLCASLSACPSLTRWEEWPCCWVPFHAWGKILQASLLVAPLLAPTSFSEPWPSFPSSWSQPFNPFLATLSPQRVLLISGIITATSASPATQRRKASHQWLTRGCPTTAKVVGRSLEVWLSSRWQQSLTAGAYWEQNVYT